MILMIECWFDINPIWIQPKIIILIQQSIRIRFTLTLYQFDTESTLHFNSIDGGRILLYEIEKNLRLRIYICATLYTKYLCNACVKFLCEVHIFFNMKHTVLEIIFSSSQHASSHKFILLCHYCYNHLEMSSNSISGCKILKIFVYIKLTFINIIIIQIITVPVGEL